HNLAGNTKVLKNVRQATKRFLPSNLEEWSLTELYWGLDEWATGFYDTQPHSALGISPKEAFERSIAATGAREHRIFTLSRDFLILTCPSVDRGGMRTVDPQRGVKLNSNYWYWCPEL